MIAWNFSMANYHFIFQMMPLLGRPSLVPDSARLYLRLMWASSDAEIVGVF
jgi:hypothetical protein